MLIQMNSSEVQIADPSIEPIVTWNFQKNPMDFKLCTMCNDNEIEDETHFMFILIIIIICENILIRRFTQNTNILGMVIPDI